MPEAFYPWLNCKRSEMAETYTASDFMSKTLITIREDMDVVRAQAQRQT